MSKRSRFAVLSGMLLLVLLVSLACPAAVLAEDGTPPPPAAEETVQPPAEGEGEGGTSVIPEDADSLSPLAESQGDEAVGEPAATPVPADTAIPTEAPVVAETDGAVPVAEGETEETGTELTVGEVLEAAPEGTQVVVLNEDGAAEPLVTQEAAETVQNGDPMWCPATATPGAGTCTTGYTSLQDLLNYLAANQPTVAGVIWIQDSYDSSVNDPVSTGFILDGAALPTMSMRDLTIQGGWSGGNNRNVDHSAPSVFSGDSLSILNWSGSVTINDIQIVGSSATGLTVTTSDDIDLDHVTSNGNTGNGAYLETSGSSTINITSSTFGDSLATGNGSNGLEAYSANGEIVLSNVAANGNAQSGAYLENGFGGITVNSSTFGEGPVDGNGDNGLTAVSDGDIALSGVSAGGNTGDGAYVGTSLGDVSVSSSTFGDSLATGNGSVGLNVSAVGNITLSDVIANGNVQSGAYLQNIFGDITVASSTFGDSAATGNGGNGLEALSDGDITLSAVTANGNTDDGAYLDNSFGTGSISVSSSIFSGNEGSLGNMAGLEAYSNRTITLAGTTASGNTNAGAFLQSMDSITITSGTFSGNGAAAPGPGGLLAITNSGITVANVTANGNTNNGATLMAAAGDVVVSHSYFDGNATFEGMGLMVISAGGNVSLDTVSGSNTVNAVGNGIGGAVAGNNVTALNSTFSGNGTDGLQLAGGTATIVCSLFQGNGGAGVDGGGVAGSFLLNGVTFNGNGATPPYIGAPTIQGNGCVVVANGSRNNSPAAAGNLLPLHIVPVSGSEQIDLDCRAYRGTMLVLPNGDRAIFPCPIRDYGVLTGKTQGELPQPLDTGFGFLSAMGLGVVRDGQPLERTNTGMTIDFVIPAGQAHAQLAILRWDAVKSQWVEVPNSYQTGDGRFVVGSSFTGVYVLVTK